MVVIDKWWVVVFTTGAPYIDGCYRKVSNCISLFFVSHQNAKTNWNASVNHVRGRTAYCNNDRLRRHAIMSFVYVIGWCIAISVSVCMTNKNLIEMKLETLLKHLFTQFSFVNYDATNRCKLFIQRANERTLARLNRGSVAHATLEQAWRRQYAVGQRISHSDAPQEELIKI